MKSRSRLFPLAQVMLKQQSQRAEMSRSRLFPLALLLLVVAVGILLTSWSSVTPTAFLAALDTEEESSERPYSPLDWLHYKVILASRKSYPLALMIGFNCFGNVLLRKECGDKPYPNWLFGFPLCFICYTYPGAVFSDLIFVRDSPRAMSNDNIFWVFTFWFLVIQNSERVYRFLLQKHVFIILTTWWLADATRASLLFLERAVAHQPVFARAVFQAFIWCAAGPIVRVAEANVRGAPVPPLDKLLPNTLNAFKYPLVAMWMIMVAYTGFMMYFTDCNLFGAGERLTMVECGDKYEDVYAFFVYAACLLHLARSYSALVSGGVLTFGETFCMGVPCVNK